MQRALARRDVNRQVMNDYILDERETFEILGPGRFRLHRTSREYTWFVRDGIHVRSPLKFDGVGVPEASRVEYEQRWLNREKARLKRKAERERAKQKGETPPAEPKHVTISPSEISTNVLPTEPQFVSAAYFMDFKFEPGNYFLAGRELLEGQEVLKIEYYPTRLFGGEDDEKTPREVKKAPSRRDRERERERQLEQDIERKMNKTALVTLWVDPKEHQIVKYTFDNVWLDFLPAAWLVRVDEMRASMAMFQPFPGVWLPRGIDISAGITLANGSFEASYERRFSDYRQAEVKTKIRVPKVPAPQQFAPKGARPLKGPGPLPAPDDGGSGPYVAETAAPDEQVETIREIRVHGNAALSDADVLRIAGLAVGDAADAAALAAAEQRLKASGRFETIEIRRRFRSLDDPTDIAVVLLVHEKPGVITTAGGAIARPISRVISSRTMFLPILNYADGYGFTYGARFSTVDLLGGGERLSVPLTWGGTRRVALEFERTFKRGPLTRISSTAALWQRENPGFVFEPDDDDSTTERRRELRARAERNFAQVFMTGVEVSRARVDFGPLPSANQWTIGADAALDTRGNPNFPANAVYLGAGWDRLHAGTLHTNRYRIDARGYLRLIRQPVLAGRVQYFTADGLLPVYERWLVGGSSTLRGFRTGALNGTDALVTSAELRIPLTSVVSGGKVGLTVFVDAAKVGDDQFRLQDARWHRSAGAGAFLIASIFRLNLDVARDLRGDRGTRVHLSSGFAF
ncbi:MAG TPA: BamA/TamA family outer membrane protein [Vicinamibacterales bacterium]|nr:BamA/TamA family outer membrane protein [Vicinamibacterales bacterium]